MAAAAFPNEFGVHTFRQDRRPSPILSPSANRLFVSEVVDSFAWMGTVIVAAPMDGPIQGVVLQESSGAIGPRRIGAAYPPHTKVVCYRPEGAPYCYVLGAVPNWVTSARLNFIPDWIVMGSASGIGFDRVHRLLTERPQGASGLINFSAGRPCDELPGDYGYINELGVGFGIGRAAAWLRASHFCGIEAHWFDNLLRLMGSGIEIMTAASELYACDDEGEFHHVERWSPYPWETRGVLDPKDDCTREGAGRFDSLEAAREPIVGDQIGIFRVSRFRGYLGDLERTIVALPLESALSEQPERLSSSTVLPGVLDIHYGADGYYKLATAKGFMFEKNVAISVPKQTATPDDAQGDTSKDYKPAGYFGEGDAHARTEPALEDDQPGMRALLARELGALRNFQSRMALIRHRKDWKVPDEEESLLPLDMQTAAYRAPDGSLPTGDTFWMPLPSSVEARVDHRGTTRYFVGKACFGIQDDGSILFEDAYGSQIRMEGGNIVVAPRYDVIFQPGRNFQAWAPNDAVIKSGHAVDVSASNGDVRLKAHGNLMMASTAKGVLIESMADGSDMDWSGVGEDVDSRGVVIKAAKSNVIAMGKDVYVRAGVRDEHKTTGELHLDAGEGDGGVFVHGNTLIRARESFEAVVGSTGESENATSIDLRPSAFTLGGKALQHVDFGGINFSFGHESLNCRLTVAGDILAAGNLLATKNAIIDESVQIGKSLIAQSGMHIKGSAIFTGNIVCKLIAADDNNGFLLSTGDTLRASETLPPEHPAFAKEQTEVESERHRNALRDARVEDNERIVDLKDRFYTAGGLGSLEVVEDSGFSFRTPEQYGTQSNFLLFESRWQEDARKLGLTAVWKEESVKSPSTGEDTMPYPGKRIWEDVEALAVVDDKLFSSATGTSVSYREIDEDQALGAVRRVKLSEGYIVTKQNS